MLLILAGLAVQALEQLAWPRSVGRCLDVHAIAVEHLFDGAFGQVGVFPLKQPDPFMLRLLKRFVPAVEQLGARGR